MKSFQLTKNLYASYSKEEIFDLLGRQLKNNFSLNHEEEKELFIHLESVLKKLEINISGVQSKYYKRNNKLFFNPFHSGQYLVFLYYFSFNISSSKNAYSDLLADKLYFLNKMLNGVDIYHKVKLPEVFFFEHPLGSVLGRAKYGNNLFMMQGCTVGGTDSGYPTLGDNFSMYSNSKIIGNCTIGNNVILAANAYVKDLDIDSNQIVFGQYPNNIFKKNQNNKVNFNTY